MSQIYIARSLPLSPSLPLSYAYVEKTGIAQRDKGMSCTGLVSVAASSQQWKSEILGQPILRREAKTAVGLLQLMGQWTPGTSAMFPFGEKGDGEGETRKWSKKSKRNVSARVRKQPPVCSTHVGTGSLL